MLNYEAVIVYDAALDDERIRQQVEELKKVIAERQGEVLNIEEWGRRRLASPIRKKDSGYYVVVNFAISEPSLLPVLERGFRLNDSVLRHMVVKASPVRKEAPKEAAVAEKAPAAEAPAKPAEPAGSPEIPTKATPAAPTTEVPPAGSEPKGV